MKEVELYLDDHYIKLVGEDPEKPPRVLLFFRDKESQSGFPIVFDESSADILIEAVQGETEFPMNAFLLNQRFLSYGVIELVKAVIFIQDGRFWTNLHFLANGEEKIECVNTCVALEAALRNQVPIMIPEDVFIQAIENPAAQKLAELLLEKRDEVDS